MNLTITQTKLKEILPFRTLFLQETNFQIRYNACHERNWTDSYIIKVDGRAIGYGSVKGKEELAERDAIFEFYVLPTFRNKLSLIFSILLEIAQVSFIECQSNDFVLASMMYEFAKNISSDVILFEASQYTAYKLSEVTFRHYKKGDNVFDKKEEDVGEYVLDKHGEIVATGGFLLHYNIPFADLYMETKESCRQKGYGSFIIQELIKECYLVGRVPAARCNISNKASKATLIKGGLKVCGYMLTGEVKL